MIHCFIDNKIVKKFAIAYILSSSVFCVDFVIFTIMMKDNLNTPGITDL